MCENNQVSVDSGLRPAVFLDRDGTLIEDVGALDRPENIELFSDTVPALLELQKEYKLFVITNQSGVAKGLITNEQVDIVNGALDKMLRKEGVCIEEWYVCPHSRDDNCECIKPKPGFVLKAQKDYNLDLTASFVIGDHPHDVLTGIEHGVFGLYLLTGHGAKHLCGLESDKLAFHNLSEAVEWILAHSDHVRSLQKQMDAAAELIRSGGVAAFPTETVYGLGADVFQPEAVEKIFKVKGRPHYNPLIAHISDVAQLEQLAAVVPDAAWQLIDAFWPGPLTLVFPKKDQVPDIVTGGLDTVAVRMPMQPLALELISRCETPVAAPSANKFTYTSPTTAGHVREQLGDQCEVIIDGGACRIGVESTVLSFTGSTPTLLRPGGVPVEDIEELIGHVGVPSASQEESVPAESPGMMPNHYAPATKVCAFATIPEEYEQREDIGILLFAPSQRKYAGQVEVISKYADTREAAANYFAALRRLDSLNLSLIIAEYAPDHGLGRAINNRLLKAVNGRRDHSE